MNYTPRTFTALELEKLNSLLSRMDTAIRSGEAASQLLDPDTPAAHVIDASSQLQHSLLDAMAQVIFPADFARVMNNS